MILAVVDSNSVDPLIDDSDTWELVCGAVRVGRLRLLYTHVTLDEIEQTPDRGRRRLLSEAIVAIGERVPTGAFVLGVSRLGEARLTDDAEGFECLRRGRPADTNDALIAVTAQYEGCRLITGDKRIAGRARAMGIAECDMTQLCGDLSGSRAAEGTADGSDPATVSGP